MMSLSKGTQAWKSRYYLLLVLFLGAIGVLIYFYGFSYFQQESIASLEQEIKTQNQDIDRFYQNTGFKEFMAVKELEASRTHLPWSDYVEKILSILAKIRGVEEGRENKLILSDFKVNLEELSLNGVASNLKTLYLAPNSGSGFSLLDEFNNLEFLKDITIRKYEKSQDTRGFKFTLSAKVVNDAWTESTVNQ